LQYCTVSFNKGSLKKKEKQKAEKKMGKGEEGQNPPLLMLLMIIGGEAKNRCCFSITSKPHSRSPHDGLLKQQGLKETLS
jgi:hypothetical protein